MIESFSGQLFRVAQSSTESADNSFAVAPDIGNPWTKEEEPLFKDRGTSAQEGETMSEHDEGRRAFIVGAVGAVAGSSLIQTAEAEAPRKAAKASAPLKTAEVSPAKSAVEKIDGHGAFLNDEHAATVAAFAERLMPGAPGKPGAGDCDVLNYIDLALAGAYADQQDFYRRGLDQLDVYCRKAYE